MSMRGPDTALTVTGNPGTEIRPNQSLRQTPFRHSDLLGPPVSRVPAHIRHAPTIIGSSGLFAQLPTFQTPGIRLPL